MGKVVSLERHLRDIQPFYVTFGVQYDGKGESPQHPLRMVTQGYAVIEAPRLAIARLIAHAVFGQDWAFIYETRPTDTQKPKGELMRLAWTWGDDSSAAERALLDSALVIHWNNRTLFRNRALGDDMWEDQGTKPLPTVFESRDILASNETFTVSVGVD